MLVFAAAKIAILFRVVSCLCIVITPIASLPISGLAAYLLLKAESDYD
jgi:hypothetical protein